MFLCNYIGESDMQQKTTMVDSVSKELTVTLCENIFIQRSISKYKLIYFLYEFFFTIMWKLLVILGFHGSTSRSYAYERLRV